MLIHKNLSAIHNQGTGTFLIVLRPQWEYSLLIMLCHKITFANIVQLKLFTAAKLTLSCDIGRQTL